MLTTIEALAVFDELFPLGEWQYEKRLKWNSSIRAAMGEETAIMALVRDFEEDLRSAAHAPDWNILPAFVVLLLFACEHSQEFSEARENSHASLLRDYLKSPPRNIAFGNECACVLRFLLPYCEVADLVHLTDQLFDGPSTENSILALEFLPSLVRHCTRRMEDNGERTTDYVNRVATGLQEIDWEPAQLGKLCELVRETPLLAQKRSLLVHRLIESSKHLSLKDIPSFMEQVRGGWLLHVLPVRASQPRLPENESCGVLQLLLLLTDSAADTRKLIVSGILNMFDSFDHDDETLNKAGFARAKQESLKNIYAAVCQIKDLGSKLFKSTLKDRSMLTAFPVAVALTLAGNCAYCSDMLSLLIKSVKELASHDANLIAYQEALHLLEEPGDVAPSPSRSTFVDQFRANISTIIQESIGGPSSLSLAIIEFGFSLMENRGKTACRRVACLGRFILCETFQHHQSSREHILRAVFTKVVDGKNLEIAQDLLLLFEDLCFRFGAVSQEVQSSISANLYKLTLIPANLIPQFLKAIETVCRDGQMSCKEYLMILLRKAIYSGDAVKRQSAAMTLLQPICLSGNISHIIEYLRRCLNQEFLVRQSIYREVIRALRAGQIGPHARLPLLELLYGHLMLFYETTADAIPFRFEDCLSNDHKQAIEPVGDLLFCLSELSRNVAGQGSYYVVDSARAILGEIQKRLGNVDLHEQFTIDLDAISEDEASSLMLQAELMVQVVDATLGATIKEICQPSSDESSNRDAQMHSFELFKLRKELGNILKAIGTKVKFARRRPRSDAKEEISTMYLFLDEDTVRRLLSFLVVMACGADHSPSDGHSLLVPECRARWDLLHDPDFQECLFASCSHWSQQSTDSLGDPCQVQTPDELLRSLFLLSKTSLEQRRVVRSSMVQDAVSNKAVLGDDQMLAAVTALDARLLYCGPDSFMTVGQCLAPNIAEGEERQNEIAQTAFQEILRLQIVLLRTQAPVKLSMAWARVAALIGQSMNRRWNLDVTEFESCVGDIELKSGPLAAAMVNLCVQQRFGATKLAFVVEKCEETRLLLKQAEADRAPDHVSDTLPFVLSELFLHLKKLLESLSYLRRIFDDQLQGDMLGTLHGLGNEDDLGSDIADDNIVHYESFIRRLDTILCSVRSFFEVALICSKEYSQAYHVLCDTVLLVFKVIHACPPNMSARRLRDTMI
eukprot:scaffold1766_cov401-Prasinococcus_capsulatus_cf.AAC.43